MILTEKQKIILRIVCAGQRSENGELEAWVDIDQIMSRCGYPCTKQAMQFSIRYLEKKGLISKSYEKRRGARRLVVSPRALAFDSMSSFIDSTEDNTEKSEFAD